LGARSFYEASPNELKLIAVVVEFIRIIASIFAEESASTLFATTTVQFTFRAKFYGVDLSPMEDFPIM
jgi:hypothetical protein